jgi:hypothetical protein
MVDGDDAEIIPLFADPEGEPPLTGKERPPYCWHKTFLMDGESRRVHCRECGREVDAFDALDHFRQEWERYMGHLESTKRELELRRGELEDVKRQVKNAKAQKRRASK